MKKLFALSVCAIRIKGETYFEHGARYLRADSSQEAELKGILYALEKWPADDGWRYQACSAQEIDAEYLQSPE